MNAEAETIEIENTGPIQRLAIRLKPGGGVTVLKGPNAAGKTTSVDAVRALVGAKVDLAPRDGTLVGRVSGLGARLTIGHKVIRQGEVEVAHLEHDLDPSVIPEPGIKDPEAADMERAKFLCRVGGVDASLDLFSEVLGRARVEAVAGLASGPKTRGAESVPEMQKWLKRDFELAARNEEKQADGLRGMVAGLTAASDGVPLDDPSDERELAAAAEASVRELAAREEREREARRAVEARAAAEKVLATTEEPESAEAIEGAILEADAAFAAAQVALDVANRGETPEVKNAAMASAAAIDAHELAKGEVEAARAAVVLAESRAEEARRRRLEATGAVDSALAAARREASAVLSAARERASAARGRAEDAARLERLRDAARLALEGTAGAADPARAAADVRAQVAVVEAARKAQEHGAVVRRAKEKAEEAAGVLRRVQAHLDEAGELRACAAGCEEVVARAIGRASPAGIRMVAGRLVLETKRGETYLSDLSTGELWRIALPAVIAHVGRGGIVAVRQEAWEALDPEGRDYVDREAAAAGVHVLTGEATGGELRSEAHVAAGVA